MADQEASVKKVIDEPMAVYLSDTHPHRHVLYRPSELKPPFDRGFLRVIVEYHIDARRRTNGRVITAFPVDRHNKTGEQLWPK